MYFLYVLYEPEKRGSTASVAIVKRLQGGVLGEGVNVLYTYNSIKYADIALPIGVCACVC